MFFLKTYLGWAWKSWPDILILRALVEHLLVGDDLDYILATPMDDGVLEETQS